MGRLDDALRLDYVVEALSNDPFFTGRARDDMRRRLGLKAAAEGR